MRNIEIKMPLRDRRRVEERLAVAGAKRVWVRRQIDTFFDAPEARLKLREEENGPTRLISYRRASDRAAPRPSDYDVVEVVEPETWKRLLGRALPLDRVVEKERTLWLHRNTRIHLDRVQGLGEYLELETVLEDISEKEGRIENARLIELLELERQEFVSLAYRDLLEERAGIAARAFASKSDPPGHAAG